MNDACKGPERIGEVLELFDVFVQKKDAAIFHPLLIQMSQRVVGKRRRAIGIATSLEPSSLVIIRTKDRNLSDKTIIYELLGKDEVNVCVSVRERLGDALLSFRVSKGLTQEQYALYRVDQLASTFGGGGHKAASGAIVSDADRAVERILEWGRKRTS